MLDLMDNKKSNNIFSENAFCLLTTIGTLVKRGIVPLEKLKILKSPKRINEQIYQFRERVFLIE